MQRFAFLLVIIALFACKQQVKQNKKETTTTPYVPSPKNFVRKPSKQDSIDRLQYEREFKNDSIQADKMLLKSIEIANKLKNKPRFYKKIDKWNYKGEASQELRFGNLFDKHKKHLIVKTRVEHSVVKINVFLLKQGDFTKVLNIDDWYMSYTGDTIRDVNGDHTKDFLYSWYASSGCCARNATDVYVYLKNSGTFSEKLGFVNADFSPSEKLIRGVKYGHPGEVPLYKYKWNGLKVDTIEYIYPADTLKKKFYRVKRYKDLKDPQKRKILSSVPKEYRNITGYDWFMHY